MRSFQYSIRCREDSRGLLYGNSQSGRSHGCVNGSDLASRESNNLRETRHFCINETAVKRIQNHPASPQPHRFSGRKFVSAKREKREGRGKDWPSKRLVKNLASRHESTGNALIFRYNLFVIT